MATSGCGNRLAGGNQFFQGPKGGPGGPGHPGDPTRPPSPWLSKARRHSLTWHHRFPRLPPAMSPQGLPTTWPPAPIREPYTPAANRCTNYQAGKPPRREPQGISGLEEFSREHYSQAAGDGVEMLNFRGRLPTRPHTPVPEARGNVAGAPLGSQW